MKTRTCCLIITTATLLAITACSDSEFSGGSSSRTNVNHKSELATPARPVEQEKTAEPEIAGPELSADCVSRDQVVIAGQSATLQFAKDPGELAIKQLSGSAVTDLGTAERVTETEYKFKAPATIKDVFAVTIQSKNASADIKACKVAINKPGNLGIDTTVGQLNLMVAKIYRLTTGAKTLPNFDPMTVIRTLYFPEINVTRRDFSQGFPGATDLTEYFGVRFEFTIDAPVDGDYQFHMNDLDDGAKLHHDGKLVLNFDGWADGSGPTTIAYRNSTFATVKLTSGISKNFKLDYFQGPRTSLGVVLRWKRPGQTVFETIPARHFGPAR